MKILISACLLGISCRYDGASQENREAAALASRFELVPFCPEIYGGLPTPRSPSERVKDRVVSREGKDVTEAFSRGARECLRLCRLLGIRTAILKEKSPSCGSESIYDGSFSGTLTAGDGVTAALLRKEGIAVYSEKEIPVLLAQEEKET